MNFESVEEIAQAVLYEGYMLYPYRPSSVKNQHRFNFGVLCPERYCESQFGAERHSMRTECLLRANPHTRITVKVRFLQLVDRSIQMPDAAGLTKRVNQLEVNGRVYQSWQEAEERSAVWSASDPASITAPSVLRFSFPGGTSTEELRDAQGRLAGKIVREWQKIDMTVHLRVEPCANGILKLSVRIENSTEFDTAGPERTRDAALLYSLVSTHAVLGVEDGQFVSLLEPPAETEPLAQSCRQDGLWPVLAGEDATTMLASPIILYDYPKIAPESAGNLFDGTEIDEILSLRILTLTDAEKAEIRRSDDRARELLERTESIPDEQFLKLHGVLRGLTAVPEKAE